MMPDSQLDWTRPMSEMVARSLPNIGSTFFLIVDQKYHEDRPFFVWAGSRADAVETVEAWGRWARLPCQVSPPDPILSGDGNQGKVE